jgi:hypothetical protein
MAVEFQACSDVFEGERFVQEDPVNEVIVAGRLDKQNVHVSPKNDFPPPYRVFALILQGQIVPGDQLCSGESVGAKDPLVSEYIF